MANFIELVIVTPERQLLSENASEITLPGAEGELGILPEHAALITELGIGPLQYRKAGEGTSEVVAVSRGFAEVLPHRVTVLAEIAERPEEINVERAKAALERAEKRIAEGPATQDLDWDRATAALQRALVRIKVAEYAPRKHGAMVAEK